MQHKKNDPRIHRETSWVGPFCGQES